LFSKRQIFSFEIAAVPGYLKKYTINFSQAGKDQNVKTSGTDARKRIN
jgi:hypothetical protein